MATWASSRPTSRTDTVRHGWAHAVTDGQAHWDSPVRTSAVQIHEPQQYTDADGRGTQVRYADGQPRISRFDGMVMWHKLCRKLFHEKKANVLMQVAIGLRALPHSTIVRASTEPDGHCFFLACTTTTQGAASPHPRMPNEGPRPGPPLPRNRRLTGAGSQGAGARSTEKGEKVLGATFWGAKRRLTTPDPATRGGQRGPLEPRDLAPVRRQLPDRKSVV